MKVLVVGDFPIYYGGERHLKDSELTIKAEDFNAKLFLEVEAPKKKMAQKK